MKRIIGLLMACTLLLAMVGCSGGKSNREEPYAPLEPLTYTGLPTELKAEPLGSLSGEISLTSNGIIYREGEKYGIITPDGKVDSGAIYAQYELKNDYFLVSKSKPSAINGIEGMNVTGVVDAAGNVRIPLEYAQIMMMDDRFARVVEITATVESEKEGVIAYVDDNGEKVHCAGTWYIYDMQTGEKVPGATGTTRYATYTYGSYVKYVTDDKKVVVSTPGGKEIPEKAVHLLNGYYVIEEENAVYNGDGEQIFTYDPAGYIPCESKDYDQYILAKKQVDGKDSFVLMDLTGKVVTTAFAVQPRVYGELLLVGSNLVAFNGTVVAENNIVVYWESLYGQCWVSQTKDARKAISKDGTVLYEGGEEDPALDVHDMLLSKKVDGKEVFYSVKDKDYTLTGVAMAPFIVKVSNGESYYDLVNVLTGEVILGGYTDYRVKIIGGVLYVYAIEPENNFQVYAIR